MRLLVARALLMSHSLIFMPFRDGEPCSVPTQSVARILATHHFNDFELADGTNAIHTPLDTNGNATIGDHVSVNCDDGQVSEIAIDRPLYDTAYRRLAFDLLTHLNLAMMSSGGETLRTAPTMTNHVPDDVLSQFYDTDTDVQELDQLP